MKKNLLSAVALGALFAVPSMAVADEGWYLSGGVGYGSVDTEFNGSLTGDAEGVADLREKLALGYDWASGWRLEGELAHRFNDTGAVGNFEDSHSDVHIWTGMLNLYYDFDRGGWWTPYVGAGIGWAQQDVSAFGWSTQNRPIPNAGAADARYTSVQDSDTSLAWNLIAGIGWELSERLTLDTEYRYFSTGSTSYTPGLDADGYNGHEGWVGLRYAFGAPAAVPPPPPPPPACEDVDFVVYFNWDRSNLTSQARSVVNQAINEARNCGVASVSIDGHADRSGAAAYNVGLSERRARAVRDEMIRLGVPGAAISLSAFGESQPAQATPDGVREPLNRRAEVLIDLN